MELLNNKNKIKYKATKEELIILLQDTANKLGRTPKYSDLKERNTIVRRFGSWNNALIESGISISKVRVYTKEELINQVKDSAEKLGRTPSSADCPNLAKAALNHFGCWNNLLLEADLSINSYNTKIDYTNDELIDIYVTLSNRLGKLASSRDIKKYLDFNSIVYSYRFGSFIEVKKIALKRNDLNIKDTPIYDRTSKYSEYDINNAIKLLQNENLINELKTKKDVINYLQVNNLPSLAYIKTKKNFRSYKDLFSYKVPNSR